MISLDTSTLSTEDSVRICAGLARVANERELSVEIAAPQEAGGGRPSPETLRKHLEALARKGLEPRFIRLRSTTILPLDGGEVEGDFGALRELEAVAAERGASLAIEDRGTPSRLLSSWTAAGVRKVDAGQPFARPVLSALSGERQEELLAKAREAGVGLAELLGRTEAPLGAVAPELKERVEAIAYGEALDLLEVLGGVGSATRAMGFLSGGAGY
jgi:hypothetical protein